MRDEKDSRPQRARTGLRPSQKQLAEAQEKLAARRARDALPLRIETARLVLRAPMRSDAHDLMALADNINVAKWLSRLPHPYRLDHAVAFIEHIAPGPDERPYAITRDGRLIGVIGLMFTETPAELGYWLGEPHWGQGYATEAGRALIEAARNTGRFDGFQARAVVDNKGSRHVLEKLGFLATGTAIQPDGTNAGKQVMHYRMEAGS